MGFEILLVPLISVKINDNDYLWSLMNNPTVSLGVRTRRISMLQYCSLGNIPREIIWICFLFSSKRLP